MDPAQRKELLPDGAQLAIAKAVPCAKSTVSKVVAGDAKRLTKITRSITVRVANRLGKKPSEVFPEYYSTAA